jgi:hypothetical protein
MCDTEDPDEDVASFPIHRWTLLLNEARDQVVLQMEDSAMIEIPLTLDNAEKLAIGLQEIVRVAREQRPTFGG